MLEAIETFAREFGADLHEKKGLWELSKVIAERKGFLSKKKLTYTAKFRVDDQTKTVKFTEMLSEKSSGLSSGGFDGSMDSSPGFGFKKEVYKSGAGGREGSIAEQSVLFGKEYRYDFDYREIRSRLEAAAAQAGYRFAYQITAAGL
jgi:hypothetical protein